MLNLELNALDKIEYTVCIGNKNITTSTFFLHSFWKSVGEPLRINSHTHTQKQQSATQQHVQFHYKS